MIALLYGVVAMRHVRGFPRCLPTAKHLRPVPWAHITQVDAHQPTLNFSLFFNTSLKLTPRPRTPSPISSGLCAVMAGPKFQRRGCVLETKIAAASFLEYCRLRKLSPKTIGNYRWAINRLAVKCRQLPQDHHDILAVLAADGLASESRHDLERVLRQFFGWCNREFDLPNPMLRVARLPRSRTLPRVLSRQEIDAVWRACQTPRARALVGLALDTGLRLGEIAAMRRSDLGEFSLRVTGKVGTRQVPVSPSLLPFLQAVGDERHFWVSERTGRPLAWPGVKQAYERILRRPGLTGPKLGPHTLRHTFGTEYCRLGGNVRALQTIMGHKRLETTMIYVHLAGLAVAEDHARSSPFLNLLPAD